MVDDMITSTVIDQVAQEQLEQAAPIKEAPVEDKVQQNLIAMRKKMEAEEYARRESERKTEEEEELGDPDDFVHNKMLQKTNKRFTSKLSESEQKLKALEQKLQYLEAKSELDSIKDFKEVVTDENVKTFARLYQDDYETVMANPNLKGKAKTLYNMIKNYGITSAAPLLKQNHAIKAADNKIESNRMKPGVAASAPMSSSPLVNSSRYNSEGRLILTEEDAQRINAETRRKIQGIKL